MPRELLRQSWEKWRGNADPVYLDDLRAKEREILTAEVFRRGGFKSGDNANDSMLLEFAARPMAALFEVSAEAMRIRLEGIGLLSRKNEKLLF